MPAGRQSLGMRYRSAAVRVVMVSMPVGSVSMEASLGVIEWPSHHPAVGPRGDTPGIPPHVPQKGAQIG